MAGVGAVGVGENEREGAQGGAGVLVHRREGGEHVPAGESLGVEKPYSASG